jgi:hypothetical protein
MTAPLEDPGTEALSPSDVSERVAVLNATVPLNEYVVPEDLDGLAEFGLHDPKVPKRVSHRVERWSTGEPLANILDHGLGRLAQIVAEQRCLVYGRLGLHLFEDAA